MAAIHQTSLDQITQSQADEYELYERIRIGLGDPPSELRRGVQLIDAALKALAWLYQHDLCYSGEHRKDYQRRSDVLFAALETSQLDAAGIAVPRTGNNWLHVVCLEPIAVVEIQMLLDHGAAAVINARNKAGDTPLHCYLRRGFEFHWERPSRTGLRLLLDYRADPTLTNPGGQTPADIAWAARCETARSRQHQRALLHLLGEPGPA